MCNERQPKKKNKDLKIENLKSTPTRIDDLKADVQVLLEKITLGDEVDRQPLVVDAYFKQRLIEKLREFRD